MENELAALVGDAQQLLDEVGARVSALGALLGPDVAIRLDRAAAAFRRVWSTTEFGAALADETVDA